MNLVNFIFDFVLCNTGQYFTKRLCSLLFFHPLHLPFYFFLLSSTHQLNHVNCFILLTHPKQRGYQGKTATILTKANSGILDHCCTNAIFGHWYNNVILGHCSNSVSQQWPVLCATTCPNNYLGSHCWAKVLQNNLCFHCCVTVFQQWTQFPLLRNRHIWAHKVFFVHATVWRTPENDNRSQWKNTEEYGI
jgi:hypothetical protein